MKRTDEQILAAFVSGNTLKVIPAKRTHKLLVLKWLVERFEAGVEYTEAEVNRLIGQSHPDFATLRRELYDNRLLDRGNGIYKRPG